MFKTDSQLLCQQAAQAYAQLQNIAFSKEQWLLNKLKKAPSGAFFNLTDNDLIIRI